MTRYIHKAKKMPEWGVKINLSFSLRVALSRLREFFISPYKFWRGWDTVSYNTTPV